MKRLIGTMLLLYGSAAWAAGPPDAATWARLGKIEAATKLNLHGFALYRSGKLPEAVKVFEEVVARWESLYPQDRHPEGHPYLVQSLSFLAELHRSQGEYTKAELLGRRALEMAELLYPQTRFPEGHPNLGRSLSNLAVLHQTRGDLAKAEPLFRRALEMAEAQFPKARYPQGHPFLAIGLDNLAGLYKSQGEYAKSESLYERALQMIESQFPRARYPHGHPDLARSLNNLALLHKTRGEYARAESLYARALEMNESMYPKARYPNGHAHLAISLNNLASLHQSRGEHAKADPLFRRVLEMRKGQYPKEDYPQGHPELANSLNNLAGSYRLQREYAEAELLFRLALEMIEAQFPKARYPQGHPVLARSLNNLADVYQSQGDYAKAESLGRRALAMRETLYEKTRYPRGHPELAGSLLNVATLHEAKGEYEKAEPLFRRALQIFSDSATSLAAFAPESTALNYLASQPRARDAYLSVTIHLPKSDAYPSVWHTKAALARVSERRNLAILATSSTEARKLWDAILSLKRERESLLLAPARGDQAGARDARLDGIDEAIRKTAADLGPLLPALGRSDDIARATPADLQKALPAGAALIDFLHYVRSEQDPRVPGDKGLKHAPHYLAFVLTRGAIARVELGAAKPIEEALGYWRQAIDEDSDSHAKYAGILRGLVWAPLAKHLPAATKTVYLCPDMDLSRLPWAALPGKLPGTILLEDYTLATVPHGPFLLDQLTAKRQKAPARPTVLAMGGVAYDKEPARATEVASLRSPVEGKGLWPELKGTAVEVASLRKMLAGRELVTLTADKASIAALLAALPRADHTHLATHGYFADKKFRSVLQLDEKLFGRMGNERSSAGARNPMVLSGLVCAGANLEGTPNRGIVTADAIVGLDLRRLNLAVLSACETGLGDVAGGEGVFGLTRAFHVAGTRNVVASLWKVDDEATAALMALFYRNLWEHELGPAEAMRQAQLSVYRTPQNVKEWAAGRGPLAKPVGGPKTKPPAKGAKVASPKVYAAFVVSGVAR